MMKCILLLLVGSLISLRLPAQWAIPAQMRATNTLDRLSSTTGGMSASDILYGVPLPAGAVVGDDYLDKKWNRSTILLYQSERMLEGYFTRYDIKSNLIEVKTKTGIKALDIVKVKNVLWIDSLTYEPHYYVNGKEFTMEGAPLEGLLEVIVDGHLPLLKKTELDVKEPTYVVAFDVGSRDTKIYKKEIFLYAANGELHTIKNKKDLTAASGSRAEEVNDLIKEHKLNVNKQSGLKSVFEFLNK